MAKKKPRFYEITVMVSKEKVYERGARQKGAMYTDDGLSDLERGLFGIGANTVELDGKTYRKIEDQARLDGDRKEIIRLLSYRLGN